MKKQQNKENPIIIIKVLDLLNNILQIIFKPERVDKRKKRRSKRKENKNLIL